jgi:hypothetical protein
MADYNDLIGGDPTAPDPTTPTPTPSTPTLQLIPNMGGAQYDPATGDVYDQNGNKVPGHYDAGSNTLTDPTGKTYVIGANPNYDPKAPVNPTNPTVNTPFRATTTETPTPTPTGTAPPPPPPSGLPSPFTSTFTAPNQIPYPTAPTFAPPTWTTPPAFSAPTLAEAQQTPGYQFALTQGLGAISNSQAAQGLWASGATGKAMQDYAQNYANQFYGDVYNRAMGQYLTNVQTQYATPYEEQLKSAEDLYQGQLGIYNTQMGNTLARNQYNWEDAYNKWLADFNQKYNTAQFMRDTAAM